MKISDKTNKRLTWGAGVVAFVFCFHGVMTGNDVAVINTLMIVTAGAVGYTVGQAIKRWRSRGE
jgi:hypothetical protein